jgi:hypothetical protein
MTQCGWVKTPASSSDSPAIAVSARLALVTATVSNARSLLSVLSGSGVLVIRMTAAPGQTAMKSTVTTARSAEDGGRGVAAKAIQPEAASGTV